MGRSGSVAAGRDRERRPECHMSPRTWPCCDTFNIINKAKPRKAGFRGSIKKAGRNNSCLEAILVG